MSWGKNSFNSKGQKVTRCSGCPATTKKQHIRLLSAVEQVRGGAPRSKPHNYDGPEK